MKTPHAPLCWPKSTLPGLGAALVLLAGCVDVPELTERVPPSLERASYPALVPLERLLGPELNRQEEDQQITDQLKARQANLRRRADALRGDVVDAQTRQRMTQGVDP